MGESHLLDRKNEEPSWLRLPQEFVASAFAGAIQSPYNGVAQLVDHVTGSSALPELHAVAPPAAKFGSSDWYAEQAGSAVGMGAVLFGLHKGVSAAADRILPIEGPAIGASADSLLQRSTSHSILDAATRGLATGAVYGTVFQPTEDNKNFWQSRAINGASSGLAFATLSAVGGSMSSLADSAALRSTKLSGLIANPVVEGFVGGLPAGAVSSETSSILNGKGLSSTQDVVQNAYGYAIAGGVMGGLDAATSSAKSNLAQEPVSDAPAAKPVTLLLDGGGVRGWGHIGFLDYLERNKVNVKDEYGVSIGSLVATLHTNGFNARQIQDLFHEEFRNPHVLQYLPKQGTAWELARFKNLEPLMKYFVDKYNLKPQENLHIVTFGVRGRKPVIFEGTNYNLASAMAASTAIPGPFRWVRYTPVKNDASEPGIYRSMRLIDGGIREMKKEDFAEGTNLVVSKLLNENDPGLFKTLFGDRLGPRIDSAIQRAIGKPNATKGQLEKHFPVVNVGHPDVHSLGFVLPDEQLFGMVDYGRSRAQQSLSGLVGDGTLPKVAPPKAPSLPQLYRTVFGIKQKV